MNDFNYEERCIKASKQQGIEDIVEALSSLGIKATSEQTGGFTMCAYIVLQDGKYIYANPYGSSLYNADDYEDDIQQFDEAQSAETIAQAIQNYIKGE
jgi:hypothetical protein